MSTAEELIREAQHAVARMNDPLDAMEDFTGLICVLLTAPDIEDDCPGLHRLVHVVRKHLAAVKEQQNLASTAIRRLGNP